MPMIEPVSVIWLAPERAIPKSVTFSRPSGATTTLCGLMSRWTIPLRCAKPTAAEDLARVVDRDRDRGRPAGDEELLEGAALQVLHRDVVRALRLAAVVDRDDVRVGETGRVLRLAAEALDELLVLRVPVVEHLDRDAATELLVLGEVDVGHPAGAELADDLVAAVEDLVDEGVGARHPPLR